MNESLAFTRHAAARRQQRAIPPLIVQWLLEFGAEEKSHGALVRYFDRSSTRRLAREVGAQVVDRLSCYLQAYLVEGTDGQVITVGYRHERIRRAS